MKKLNHQKKIQSFQENKKKNLQQRKKSMNQLNPKFNDFKANKRLYQKLQNNPKNNYYYNKKQVHFILKNQQKTQWRIKSKKILKNSLKQQNKCQFKNIKIRFNNQTELFIESGEKHIKMMILKQSKQNQKLIFRKRMINKDHLVTKFNQFLKMIKQCYLNKQQVVDKRLALAEFFGSNCGVFALDEPTTHLDDINTEALAMFLK